MRPKKWSVYLSLIILLGNIGFLTIKHELHLANLSDTLFLSMLPFLIIAVFLWILSSGVFDFFHYSMKKAFKKLKEDDLTLSQASKGSSHFFFEISGLLLLSSVLCLLFSGYF